MTFVDFRIKIEQELLDQLNEIKDFYGLNSNAELFRLMIVRFYRFVKDMKEKGYDKFSLIP